MKGRRHNASCAFNPTTVTNIGASTTNTKAVANTVVSLAAVATNENNPTSSGVDAAQ